MEGLNESNNSKDNYKEGFFKYVFNFDEKNVNGMLNMFQYSFIAVPFVILILKVLNYYTPEEDESKGTLEISAEIVGSISLILLSIWFINRIINYIPTYTKTDYPNFNEINCIIPLFILLFTIKTKLGGKINILVDRLVNLYEGKTNLKAQSHNQNDYKTIQPISQVPLHQNSQADFLNQQQMQNSKSYTESQYLNSVHNNLPQQQQPQEQQQQQQDMYQGPINPLLGAMEPMAANEGMGNMFGSAF